MESYPALHRFNRSEAPTSVALAMLLAEPALGRRLLAALAASLAWTMASWDGVGATQPFDLGEGTLEASALFYPHRDAGGRSGKTPAAPDSGLAVAPWRGEIDVVAVVPRHVVVGIELKVLSSRSKLADQMDKQVQGLRLLADIYDCPFRAQIALAPAFPETFPERVNRLRFVDLIRELQALRDEHAPMNDLVVAVQRQVELAVRLTKRRPLEWTFVTLGELLTMGGQPGHAKRYVGVREGLSELKVQTRLRWKVAAHRLGPSWYPLNDVVDRIGQVSQRPN